MQGCWDSRRRRCSTASSRASNPSSTSASAITPRLAAPLPPPLPAPPRHSPLHSGTFLDSGTFLGRPMMTPSGAGSSCTFRSSTDTACCRLLPATGQRLLLPCAAPVCSQAPCTGWGTWRTRGEHVETRDGLIRPPLARLGPGAAACLAERAAAARACRAWRWRPSSSTTAAPCSASTQGPGRSSPPPPLLPEGHPLQTCQSARPPLHLGARKGQAMGSFCAAGAPSLAFVVTAFWRMAVRCGSEGLMPSPLPLDCAGLLQPVARPAASIVWTRQPA